MNKRLAIALAVVIILITSGVAYATYKSPTKTDNPPNADSSSSQTNMPNLPSDGTSPEMTITGVMECLTLKDTNGPADSSCAIGVKADDGKSYSLNAGDPTLTGSVPTGQRVKITGILSEQSSKYDSVGVIQVSSLERE